MKHMIVALLAVLLYLPATASPYLWTAASVEETKVLQASKDNTLIESSKGELSSGLGQGIFVGRTGQSEGGIRRGLIAFDIASAIPAGSKITSVKLTLNVRLSANGDEEAQVKLHQVLADWGEGSSESSGRGAPAAEGDATWIHTFYPKRLWSKPGGDYATGDSATQSVAGVGIYNWGSTPRMVADVQAWLDSPDKNFGWLLFGDETMWATAKVFHSRESNDKEDRPQLEARPRLTVTFIPPTKKK